jgi:hypothetical protein
MTRYRPDDSERLDERRSRYRGRLRLAFCPAGDTPG